MVIRNEFNFKSVDPSWRPCLQEALTKMSPEYLETLYTSKNWLPGADNIFNAFSLPLTKTQYVLFGESPYPREQSANGYAFWDNAVRELWSETGLSKAVNRATSLRNMIKMLLIAEGFLSANTTTQTHIAKLDKSNLIQTNQELFSRLLERGFLLLNATLVLQPQNKQVKKDAKMWHPFVQHVLNYLFENQSLVKLILFGNIANSINQLNLPLSVQKLYSEHPYNLSFIQNSEVIQFFRPLHLLRRIAVS